MHVSISLSTFSLSFPRRGVSAQVPSIFNESKTIFAAVYQMTFILAFVVPTAAYVSDPLVSQIARQAGLSVGIFACIGILFWPPLRCVSCGEAIMALGIASMRTMASCQIERHIVSG